MTQGNKIYHFTDYKQFVLYELRQKPNSGRGQFLKIAKALRVHTTMITHIFKGQLHLGSEQCLALADYLGLNELETEFLVQLVLRARAGDQRTKKFFDQKIAVLKSRALNLSDRLEMKNTLSESDQATFYSSWIYAALRLLSAIPAFQNRAAMAEELKLSQAKVNKHLEFLIGRGLCVEKDGKILYGEIKTYVAQDSPFVVRHHMNWRTKVMEHYDRLQSDELAFTKPVVIAESDFAKIREELVRWIEKFNQIAEPSPSERLCCLNIDWVRIQTPS